MARSAGNKPQGPIAVIVQQGKVLDFIDSKTQREETPEEYVRQEIAKSLVREYGYPKSDIAVELTLRLGSKKPRADLVIFGAGDDHEQANATVTLRGWREPLQRISLSQCSGNSG